MSDIYLQSTTHDDLVRIAADEDTKYWIFDDSCEPVGLICEPKENYRRIDRAMYDQILSHRRAMSAVDGDGRRDDSTVNFFNSMLLERVMFHSNMSAIALGGDKSNETNHA